MVPRRGQGVQAHMEMKGCLSKCLLVQHGLWQSKWYLLWYLCVTITLDLLRILLSRHAISKGSDLAELGVGPRLCIQKKQPIIQKILMHSWGLEPPSWVKRMPTTTADLAWKAPTSPLALIANRAFWTHWPWGLSSCASGADPSTCPWATSGCMCVRWSHGAWQLLRAAGMWRCSSSSAHTSAVSWPAAHPACRTGLGAPRPVGQSPWMRECEELSFGHLGDLDDESGDPLAKPQRVVAEWSSCSLWGLVCSFIHSANTH